jgi:hypothetical protein
VAKVIHQSKHSNRICPLLDSYISMNGHLGINGSKKLGNHVTNWVFKYGIGLDAGYWESRLMRRRDFLFMIPKAEDTRGENALG